MFIDGNLLIFTGVFALVTIGLMYGLILHYKNRTEISEKKIENLKNVIYLKIDKEVRKDITTDRIITEDYKYITIDFKYLSEFFDSMMRRIL